MEGLQDAGHWPELNQSPRVSISNCLVSVCTENIVNQGGNRQPISHPIGEGLGKTVMCLTHVQEQGLIWTLKEALFGYLGIPAPHSCG